MHEATIMPGLGDWVANRERLPQGIKGIADRIEEMGMKFGLWFEPEMVNKDSDLYRAHPDWILQTPQRHSCHGRNQYVLDFSRKEVVDCIYDDDVQNPLRSKGFLHQMGYEQKYYGMLLSCTSSRPSGRSVPQIYSRSL